MGAARHPFFALEQNRFPLYAPPPWPRGGIGRRCGLKIRFQSERFSPVGATSFIASILLKRNGLGTAKPQFPLMNYAPIMSNPALVEDPKSARKVAAGLNPFFKPYLLRLVVKRSSLFQSIIQKIHPKLNCWMMIFT